MHIDIKKGGTYIYSRNICSALPFFSESIICVSLHDRLVFAKPTLDYSGKQYKPSLIKQEYKFTLPFELPIGKFKIDEEESNEDCIVVYFKDKI